MKKPSVKILQPAKSSTSPARDTLTQYVNLRRVLATVTEMMSGLLNSDDRHGRLCVILEQLKRAEEVTKTFIETEESL
jgi:hypothetical protein